MTQFVQIAAVETIEALTHDIKNKTRQKFSKHMENLFSSIISRFSGCFVVFKRLLGPIWQSYYSPSPFFFLRRRNQWGTVDFGFAVPSIFCGMFLVWNFSPSRFLAHNALLDSIWPNPLNTTLSQLLTFSLKQLSKSPCKTSPRSQWRRRNWTLAHRQPNCAFDLVSLCNQSQ